VYGQVSIEAAAAEDALARLGGVKDQLTRLLSKTGGAEVRLGANPVGEAMARKSMSRYDGADSFLAVLTSLLDQTDKAERALRRCIDEYVDIDEGHAADYGRAH
jgi:hypothetical protein